jgi:hypothetical protein
MTNSKIVNWDRIRSECSEEIGAIVKGFWHHNTMLAALTQRCLLPGRAARQLDWELRGPNNEPHHTPAEIEARAAECSRLRRIIENPEMQRHAARSLNQKFCELRQPMDSLAAAVDKSISAQIEELRNKEGEFFAQFDTEPEATKISALAVAAKNSFTAKVQRYRDTIRRMDQSPTGGSTPEFEPHREYPELFESEAQFADVLASELKAIKDSIQTVAERKAFCEELTAALGGTQAENATLSPVELSTQEPIAAV